MNENQNHGPPAPSLRLDWGRPLDPGESTTSSAAPALPWLKKEGHLPATGVPDSPEGLTERTSQEAPVGRPTGSLRTAPHAGEDGPLETPQARPATARAETTRSPAQGAETRDAHDPDEADTDDISAAAPFNHHVREHSAVPSSGWRRALHAVTGHNPGLSKAEQCRRDLARRARARVSGCRTVTVISSKGGVGKTTTTILLGSTLAEHRGDRVGALDANPDSGTLGDRALGEDLDSGITVRGLVKHVDSIDSLTDLSRHTQIKGRLQIVASDQDPAMSEAFSRDEYERVLAQLRRFFNVCLTDCGTGLMHDTVDGALRHTDTLVVVASPTVDAADRARKTLDWLVEHDYGHLVKDAVIAVSCDRKSPEVDAEKILSYFRQRCRAVVQIPFDRHLATGGPIDMEQLSQRTRDAALELAATVADGFRPARRAGNGRSS